MAKKTAPKPAPKKAAPVKKVAVKKAPPKKVVAKKVVVKKAAPAKASKVVAPKAVKAPKVVAAKAVKVPKAPKAVAARPAPVQQAPAPQQQAQAPAPVQQAPAPQQAAAVSATVNPVSGLSSTCHVLADGGQVYDIDLAFQGGNSNKFYKLQALESNNNQTYWMVQHWGRLGTGGQNQKVDFSSKQECLKAFLKKFKQKAGVAWENRGQANSNSTGKYRTLTEQRVAAAGGRIADDNTVCFCLSWDDRVDLDIHCKMPNGKACYFCQKTPEPYIKLDVDKQAHHMGSQVENIYLNKNCMDGDYDYFVRYYSGHGSPTDFTFVVNQFGKKINEGKGTSSPAQRDTPIVTIRMKGGLVERTTFSIQADEVPIEDE